MVSRPAIFESTFWLSIYPSSFSAGKRAQQLGMLRIYAKHQVAATPASALNFPRFMGFITGAEDQDSLTEFGPRCISCAPERESVLHVGLGLKYEELNLGRYASLSGSR